MPEPLKVLFVTTSFPRSPDDYAGSFVFRFAKYLVRDGCKVDTIAPSDPDAPDNEMISGVHIYRFRYFIKSLQAVAYGQGGILANLRTSWLSRIELPFFLLSLFMATFTRIRRYDIVHCHWLPIAFVALCAKWASFSKTTIIFTNWGSDTRLFPLWFQRFVLSHVDGCVSTAAETDQHLLTAGSKNFVTIPAPVDEEKLSQKFDRRQLMSEFGLREEGRVISFIGRLNYFKDPISFICACNVLKDRGVQFEALVAGGGDLYDECAALIDSKGLQDCVKLLGFREDVEKILALSWVTVHISPIENTWANVIAEAMFAGVPVIMTDVGCTRSTFTDRQDCLIVPPRNPQVLAEAVELLFENAELARHLSDGAKNLLTKYGKNSRIASRRLIEYYLSVKTQQPKFVS